MPDWRWYVANQIRRIEAIIVKVEKIEKGDNAAVVQRLDVSFACGLRSLYMQQQQ